MVHPGVCVYYPVPGFAQTSAAVVGALATIAQHLQPCTPDFQDSIHTLPITYYWFSLLALLLDATTVDSDCPK